MQTGATPADQIPTADREFLSIFLPYELRLCQRRAMVWGSASAEKFASAFLGIYMLRLETETGGALPAPESGGGTVTEHVQSIFHEVLRDSDIPVVFTEKEHVAILRDIDPEHAYVVAQRLLSLAVRSSFLQKAGVRTRVGYLIYPLSTQPNFPPERWPILLELARGIARRDRSGGPASGFGVLRGPSMDDTSITESDLIPLIFRDPDNLVKAGLLQLQRIHLAGT